MHVFFSGIGGAGLSALANLSLDLGFTVSGSDQESNSSIEFLNTRGAGINTTQSADGLKLVHRNYPIDLFVHTSALPPDHRELITAKELGIQSCKRDGLINFILREYNLKLLGVCGSNGKTTTTAMITWLFEHFQIPHCHIIGSNMNWTRSGVYQQGAEWMILEADEYDRHFLNYTPDAVVLTSIAHDHKDIYPTEKEYLEAFNDFVSRSSLTVAFDQDIDKIGLNKWQESGQGKGKIWLLKRMFGGKPVVFKDYQLIGIHNRQNAALAHTIFTKIFDKDKLSEKIEDVLNQFPGTGRRMEKLADRIYTDYAHHPIAIQATIQLAREMTDRLVIVYQPHQNSRQVEVFDQYKDLFVGIDKLFWTPTYLSREDPSLEIITPFQFINSLSNKEIAEAAGLDDILWDRVKEWYDKGYTILVFGAGNIDSWLRKMLKDHPV
jgi:UDP-N-acetylmuramate--alanine ligase